MNDNDESWLVWLLSILLMFGVPMLAIAALVYLLLVWL